MIASDFLPAVGLNTTRSICTKAGVTLRKRPEVASLFQAKITGEILSPSLMKMQAILADEAPDENRKGA